MTVSLFRVHGWPPKRGMDKDKKMEDCNKGLYNSSLSCLKDGNTGGLKRPAVSCKHNDQTNILYIRQNYYWTQDGHRQHFRRSLKPPVLFVVPLPYMTHTHTISIPCLTKTWPALLARCRCSLPNLQQQRIHTLLQVLKASGWALSIPQPCGCNVEETSNDIPATSRNKPDWHTHTHTPKNK